MLAHNKSLIFRFFFFAGFIDSYVDETVPSSYEFLHQKLFKFLLSHRLPSNLINPKKIDHQINNLNLRRKFLISQEEKYEQSDGLSNLFISFLSDAKH